MRRIIPKRNGRLFRAYEGDSAENSIMQTISIAVSAILIAGGVVTAPSLINNARDTNVKQDLSNIGTSQEYVLSNSGAYSSRLSDLINTSGTKMTTSLSPSDIGIIRGSNPDCYAVFGKSKSGKTFYKSSDSSSPTLVQSPWPALAPAPYPVSSCIYWPRSAQEATGNVAPPLSDWVLSGGATFDSSTQILTLPNYASSAQSPIFKIDGPYDFTYTLDAKIPALIDAAHNNVVMGTSYYGADAVTPEANAGGWTGNGDSLPLTQANTWTRLTSGLGQVGNLTAPTAAMKYMSITLWNGASYSQPGVQLRFPTLSVTPR